MLDTEYLQGFAMGHANYLGKGVRTVQRYARELGLPAHRPLHSAIIATKTEIDAWVKGSPLDVTSITKSTAQDLPRADLLDFIASRRIARKTGSFGARTAYGNGSVSRECAGRSVAKRKGAKQEERRGGVNAVVHHRADALIHNDY